MMIIEGADGIDNLRMMMIIEAASNSNVYNQQPVISWLCCSRDDNLWAHEPL
jgi:hypothetical protein